MVGMTPSRSVPAQRVAQPPGGVDQVVRLDQHAARARDQLLARRRRQHAPAIALEEAHAQRALELGELRAQRRLGHAAQLRPLPKLRVSATATAYWSWRAVNGWGARSGLDALGRNAHAQGAAQGHDGLQDVADGGILAPRARMKLRSILILSKGNFHR